LDIKELDKIPKVLLKAINYVEKIFRITIKK